MILQSLRLRKEQKIRPRGGGKRQNPLPHSPRRSCQHHHRNRRCHFCHRCNHCHRNRLSLHHRCRQSRMPVLGKMRVVVSLPILAPLLSHASVKAAPSTFITFAKIRGRKIIIGRFSRFQDIALNIIMDTAVALCPQNMEINYPKQNQNNQHESGADIVVIGLTKPSAREYKTSIRASASQF